MTKTIVTDFHVYKDGKLVRTHQIPYETTEEEEAFSDELFALLDEPLQYITQGEDYGLKGVKRFFLIVGIFILTGIIAIGFGLYRAFSIGVTLQFLGIVGLMFAVGVGFTVFAGYRAYQYAGGHATIAVFRTFAPVFKGLLRFMILRVKAAFEGKNEDYEKNLREAADMTKALHARYGRAPYLLKFALNFVVKQIPFIQILEGMKDEVMNGNETGASEMLYHEFDTHILGALADSLNTNWFWWLFPLFILVELLIGYVFIT
ncbi:MAG: hypothetical protein AB8F95_09850 [Bacteroidia bacterium]